MLTKRIIPCLDVRNGRVVKGKKFKDIVDVDDPATLGKFYSDSGADELVFYDITASNEERKTSLEFVKRVAEEINILNEDTVERIIEEITDIDNENVTSYFEVTNSVVITNSNIII